MADPVFDGATSGLSFSSANFDLVHTHADTTTVRGVIVLICQNGAADEVAGVTYDGVAMTEVAGSPNTKATGEPGAVYCYFLGSGIPQGSPKTATITVTGGATLIKRATVVTISGDSDMEVIDVDATINSDSVADPAVTLSLGGRAAFCCIAFHSGHDQAGAISQLTNWSSLAEVDFGSQVAGRYRYNTIGTADVTAGWTQTAEDATAIAIAVGHVVPEPTFQAAWAARSTITIQPGLAG